VLSIIAGALFMLTFAISRQEVAADAIRVGEILPAFTALDENGAMFNAASLRGHPVLIKFFRGHW
jgi:cytochrome oxidase Cu insertion factor (SCO1/SenC/PrrC family)